MISTSLIKSKPNLNFNPREKFIRFGIQNLTEIELVGLIIGSGDITQPLPILAKNTWHKISFFQNQPAKKHLNWLSEVKGLGPAKAGAIYAALELGKRIQNQPRLTKVAQPEVAFQLASKIRNRTKEYALALYLDGQHQLIDSQIIAIGGSNFAFLEPAQIFHPAMLLPAGGIILIHNHPSGNIQPSDDDLKLTLKLAAAGRLLGIPLIDHLVVSATDFYSLKEHGVLTDFMATDELFETHLARPPP